jgi:hypothetical protein
MHGVKLKTTSTTLDLNYLIYNQRKELIGEPHLLILYSGDNLEGRGGRLGMRWWVDLGLRGENRRYPWEI